MPHDCPFVCFDLNWKGSFYRHAVVDGAVNGVTLVTLRAPGGETTKREAGGLPDITFCPQLAVERNFF